MDAFTRNEIAAKAWAIKALLTNEGLTGAIAHNLGEVGPIETLRSLYRDWRSFAYYRACGKY